MKKICVFLASIGKGIMRPWFPVKVYGERKIPVKKSIIVANHLSGWDPIIFTLGTNGITPFVYKAEFRKSGFLRWAFDGLDCVPVKRGDVDMNATKSILKLLHDDKPIALFPEGTRNPNIDCLQKFRTGAALFALKEHAPIRPYYIWDKTKCLHKNYIIIGEEFTLEEFYDRPLDKETLNEATEKIRQKVDELRVQLNEILAEKGVKRRTRTKKETEATERYNKKQQNLAKRLAEQNDSTAQTAADQSVDEAGKTSDGANANRTDVTATVAEHGSSGVVNVGVVSTNADVACANREANDVVAADEPRETTDKDGE